jgi:hypothetical protein
VEGLSLVERVGGDRDGVGISDFEEGIITGLLFGCSCRATVIEEL